MTDTPLLIIKENINCGNFLNKDKFNNESLIDFSIIIIDERIYGEALFSQSEIYSNTYIHKIMTEFVKFLNSSYPDIDRLHHGYSYTNI